MARPGGDSKRSGAKQPQVSNSEAFKTAVPTSTSVEDSTWEPKSGKGRSKLLTTPDPGEKKEYQSGGDVSERYSDSQPSVEKGKGGTPPQYDKPMPRTVGGKN